MGDSFWCLALALEGLFVDGAAGFEILRDVWEREWKKRELGRSLTRMFSSALEVVKVEAGCGALHELASTSHLAI